MRTNYLVKNHDHKRIPYEDRGSEYDKLRKREERKKELDVICDELFFECEQYKLLNLTPYQKTRVKFLIDDWGWNFSKLHGKAKKEAIILSFIFYIKKLEVASIRLGDYGVLSQRYGLTNDIFELVVCRLAAYYMSKAPIVPRVTTDYDHEILSKNGGRK